MYNAIKGDELVLKKDLTCLTQGVPGKTPSHLSQYFPDKAAVVTIPKGTPLKLIKFWNNVQHTHFTYVHTFEEGMILEPFAKYDELFGLDDAYGARNDLLAKSLVISRKQDGSPIVRSKIKHDKGMWNRAAAGAEVGSYVIADKEGRRFESDCTPSSAYLLEEKKASYANFISCDYFGYWRRPPFHDGKKFLSIEEAEPYLHDDIQRDIDLYGVRKVIYKEFKKFPDLGRAKQRILYLVGYYNQFGEMGMLNNCDPVPAWTPEWFIWSATKDGEIIEPVLNCADYVVITQKYADLSKTYGIEAKEVFKKIEKADPAPVGVIIIGKFDGGDYYDDLRFIEDPNFSVSHDGQQIGEGSGYVFNSTEMTAVKEIAKLSKIKKVGKTRAAFAVMSLNDAVMIKLAYAGSLEFKIIDMDKLEEMI